MNVKAKSFGQIFLVLLLSVLLVVPSMTVAATWATPDDGNEQPGDNPDGDNNDGNNGGNNNQGAGNANSGNAGESISFYGMSSAASNYLDSVAYKHKGDFNDIFDTDVTVAAAGMGLGYVDLSELSNSPEVTQGPLWSTKSHNSQTYAYEGLSRAGDGSRSSKMVMSNAMQGYAYYGTLLTEMGFAETAMQGDSVSLYRTVTGFLLQGSYWMASSMNDILGGIIDGLQMLNPFQLFVNPTGGNDNGHDAGASARDRIYDIMKNGNGTVAGVDWGDNHANNGTALVGSDLARNVQSIYNTLISFAQTFAIPMFLAVLVVGIVFLGMDKRGGGKSNGSRVKHFLVRFLFIMIGIPLLGYCYTFSLDALSNNYNNSTQPDRIIAQTLVDFEGWATNANLDANYICGNNSPLVAVATWDGDMLASVQPSNSDNVRQYALNINRNNTALNAGTEHKADTNINVFTDETGFMNGSSSYYVVDNNTKWNPDGIVGLINRYAAGDRFTSANYEAKRVGNFDLTESDGASIFAEGTSIGDKVKDLKSTLNDSTAFGSASATDADEVNNGLLTSGLMESNTGIGFINSMSVIDSDPLAVTISGDDPTYKFTYSEGKLTDLATYNFLNTKFDQTSMTVYSPSSSVNDQSHIAYYSVTQAGTGLYGTLLMANSIAMLLSLVIIGLVYGVGLLFSNMKSAIGLIASMPLAAFGALSAIARLIGLVLIMIAEVVLTLILYDVVASFLGSFNAAILGFLPAMMKGGTSSLLAPVSCIAGLLFLVMFTIMALKVRKSVISAVTDGITGVVKKLTDADPKLPNAEGGKGFMQSVMGAARTASMLGVGQGTAGTLVKDAAILTGVGGAVAMGYGATQMGGAGVADMLNGALAGEDATGGMDAAESSGSIDSSRDAHAQTDFAESDEKANERPGMESSRQERDGATKDIHGDMRNDAANNAFAGDTVAQYDMAADDAAKDAMPVSDNTAEDASDTGRADNAYSAEAMAGQFLHEIRQVASPETTALRANDVNPDTAADAAGRADMNATSQASQQAMYEADNTVGYANEAQAAGLVAQPNNMYETSAEGSAQMAAYTPDGASIYGGDNSAYSENAMQSGLVANNDASQYSVSEMGGATNAEDMYNTNADSLKSVDASSFNEALHGGDSMVEHGLDTTMGNDMVSTGEASLSESIQNAGVPLYGQASEGGRQIENSRSMMRERVGESSPERVAAGASVPGQSLADHAVSGVTPLGQSMAGQTGAARSMQDMSTQSPLSSAMGSSRAAGAGSAAHRNASNAFAARVQSGMSQSASSATGTPLGDTMRRVGTGDGGTVPRRIESIPTRVADIPHRETSK